VLGFDIAGPLRRYRVLAFRLAKIACVASIGLYVALVAFNNITDYGANFVPVSHVLTMDQVQDPIIKWRALPSPVLHHAGYFAIISTELAIAVLCVAGAAGMARQLHGKAQAFRAAKTKAVLGLAIGVVLYEAGFVAVGGEWFAMWQAQNFDAVQSSFRIVVTMLGVLILLALPDEELA
jgi:predicted small integral membrane protein